MWSFWAIKINDLKEETEQYINTLINKEKKKTSKKNGERTTQIKS